MKSRIRLIILYLVLLSVASHAQHAHNSSIRFNEPAPFATGKDIFGTRVFVENKGQFDLKIPGGKPILFVYDYGGEKIYFTEKGLVYEIARYFVPTEEEREEMERGNTSAGKKPEFLYVKMNWLNSNSSFSIEKHDKQSHYITYGGPEYNSSTYKKLIYKNVYENIDIEYCVPNDQEFGIKYNVILHPGANVNDIKIVYSGELTKIKLDKDGDITIKTRFDDIVEHAPITYNADKKLVPSAFRLNNNIISFELPGLENVEKLLIIDPWVTAVNTLSLNNNAYDVDYDGSGNTFIYGGNPSSGAGRCKVSKFSTTGVLQWTFSGLIVTPAWSSGSIWSSNFKVHKPSGKTYVARHIVALPSAIRLDAAGNYDNFMTSGGSPAMQELWHLDFACSGDLFAFLGNQYSGAIINATTGGVTASTTFSPGLVGCCQDILAEVIDGIGDLFVYFSGTAGLNNTISKISPSYSTTIWNASSGFNQFTYLASKSAYVGGQSSNGNAVAFNALAVNMNYLFYYDGYNVAAYNKTNGSLVGSTTIAGHAPKAQGGIAVDDCNKVYVGGNGAIQCFSFTGTSFSTLTPIPLNASVTNQYVYDVQLNKGPNLLHVSGSEFVGTYSASYSGGCLPFINTCACIQPFLAVNTSSTNCVNIGASTVNVGGMPGPYTYTWLPGGQTSSVVTALNPGSYTVAVSSTSCNVTASAVTVFTSALPPYSLSVPSTSITCANLGSATVATSGMPGPFSYTWMPTAQTSSVASGLSPGTYTLSIFSGSCNLTFTATTVFTSLIPLTGTIAYDNSVTCNGASTATGAITNLAGGSGNQVYSWFNGITNYTTAFTNSLSAGIWTANVTDALTGCQVYQSFFISQPPPLVLSLSANTGTNCVGNAIVLTGTNSGGTPGYTYTWSAGPAADTHTVGSSIAGSFIYTLSSEDANSCLKSNTISVAFIPNPILTVPDVSICPFETGTLIASGASSYTWNAFSTGNTFTASPLTDTQYTLVGSALGCTSAASASLIIKPVPTPFISSNSPVCNGQNLSLSALGGTAYVWTGPLSFLSSSQNTIVTAASPGNGGAYQLTVTAANSCTASTSINLQVNPTPTISATGATLCSSQTLVLNSSSFPGSNYFWSGPQGFVSFQQNPTYANPGPNRSGAYTVIATSAVGCTNSAIAQVTVTQLPTPFAFNDGPKCVGNTISFFGSGGDAFSWTGPGGFSSVLQNPQINYAAMSAMGSYTLSVTTGPCVNSIVNSLTIHPLPTPVASNNGPVCETKALSLFASTGNTVTNYYWYGPLYYGVNPNPIRDSSTLFFAGVYTLTVQDKNMCQASAQTTVVILQNPVVSAAGTTVCLNEPGIISASGAVSYLWSGPLFYQSNLANALIASVSSARKGTYTVVGSAANSCTGTATVLVDTRELPTPSLNVLPGAKICLNESITFNGIGGQAYQWFGPQHIYYEGASVTFVATSLETGGTYTLKVTDDKGCSSTSQTVIVVQNLPVGTLSGSALKGCVPLCSDFSFLATSGDPAKIFSSWKVQGRTITGNTFSHCFTEVGQQVISGSLFDSSSTCSNKVEIFVDVFEKPVADFEFAPLKPVENSDEVVFTNSSKGEGLEHWNWYFTNNKGYRSSNEHVTFLFPEQGKYPVVLVAKNRWGCMDSILKVITVEEDFGIYVPNVFTPNEDQRNEVFLPIGRGVKTYHMVIYNRWGSKIFESSDLLKGWDGTFMGEPCKADVYTWKMELTGFNGENKDLTGHLSLLR